MSHRDRSRRKPPNSSHARRSQTPDQPNFPVANIPGPVSDRYSRPLPSYYATRGGTTYPGSWDGVDYGGSSSQFPASPTSRFQSNAAHGRMPSLQPPIVPSSHPEFHQAHPARPDYAPYPTPSPSFVHQQSLEPMPLFTIANHGSQFQGSADVQNVAGGTYYPLWSGSQSPTLSPAGSFSQFPVPPRRFDLTGELEHLPPPMPVPHSNFPRTGKRRALIIGINYLGHRNRKFRLRYCIEDAYCMANFLRDRLDFARDDVRIMTDETPWNLPTKENILREMRALVHDAQPHDSFFLYYSGHAVQIKDLNGDERDGFDECICAMDFQGNDLYPHPDTPGLIVDDLMNEIMVKNLPLNCRLTAIFDSCHSGTLLDLPYMYDSNGVVKDFIHPHKLAVLRMKSSYADVISLSASKDHQNALETSRGGALRQAFMHCMEGASENDSLTYRQLIGNVREYMRIRGFPQRPQLSSSHEIDTNLPFIV